MVNSVSIDNRKTHRIARFIDNKSTNGASSNVTLQHDEYTSEEVTEFIQIALKVSNGEDQTIISHDERLVIAQEFGLSESDLTRAFEEIKANEYGIERASEVMTAFKINAAGYALGFVGFFLLNLATPPSVWWFQFPVIMYSPILVAHGIMVKFNPELAYNLLSEETEE